MQYNSDMIEEALLQTTNLGAEETLIVINYLKQNYKLDMNDLEATVRYIVNDILEDITVLIVRYYLDKGNIEEIKKLKEKYLNDIIQEV